MKPTNKEDMFRNFALESLLKMIEEKRQQEQNEYFENLSKVSVPNIIKSDANDKIMNPLETIFTMNLRDSLISFQKYQSELQSEKDAIMDKIKKKFAGAITEQPGLS